MPEIHRTPDRLIQLVQTNTFMLRHKVATSTNPITGAQRRSAPLDIRWMGKFTIAECDRTEWAEWEAFFDRIGSLSGFFTFYDPASIKPRGVGTGVGENVTHFSDGTTFTDGTGFLDGNRAEIKTAATRGVRYIEVKGLQANANPVLRVNDMLSILHGSQNIPTLYKVVAQAKSDGNGYSTLEISPNLRYPVTEGDQISLVKPRGVFQLTKEYENQRRPPLLGRVSFEIMETPEILEADITGIT